jgi:hypothetical protein
MLDSSARCLVGQLARAMITNEILNFQIEYYRQNLIRASIFHIAITLGHRWPMRSNLQKSNSIYAFFKSTSEQFIWKCDLNLLNICFDYPSCQMGTANHKILDL